MENISLSRDGHVYARHTTESVLSHYDQPVWTIEDEDPEPGPATWTQGEKSFILDVIEVRGGWLICRQPDGILCGIIWSDGTYFADLVLGSDDEPATELVSGARVRGTVQFSLDDPNDLGAVLL